MNLDPALRAILVCPQCRGDLTDDEAAGGESGLVCPACRLRYAVSDDGIPDMLVDDAQPLG
ncbi:hypothetical protein GCM10011519_33000 [Marmoricola endophyticus]|uniref:Uncharacterized protein n=1 Tax=Marmoricola endophyticus TaxID=2040280 RepID=A0A917BRY2_9ACTN|nr:Trm112 family protein [Marmoricola endophyticus]GGF56442.1 hypothetical protein GCM10011519_33000 [Marmoricola endophyticus]